MQNSKGGRFVRALLLAVYSFAILAVPGYASAATTLPSGYSLTDVAGGLALPTNLAWLPDGTMLIAEKAGTVRAFKNGSLLPQTFIDISSTTNDYWDRGLIGIAVDPDYNNNHYVYLTRTYENNTGNYTGTKVGQLVRVTISSANTMVAGSLTVLVGKSTPGSCEDLAVTADCMPSDSPSHSVGDVVFALDGSIFVTSGDGSNFDGTDVRALRAQNLDSLGGKLLHINKDGKGIPGNPFYTGNPDDNRSKVWSYGLRNPWRFTIKPGTSTPYLADVGWDTWEEVNVMNAGGNYGWPCYEGNSSVSAYQTFSGCQTLTSKVGAGTATVQAPLTTWNHDGHGSAVVGGTFVTGTKYPTSLQGNYLFGDYAQQFMRTLQTNDANSLTNGPTDFATGLLGLVNVEQGPDGSVYLVSIADETNGPGTGKIQRLDYSGITPPPPPGGTCSTSEFKAEYFNSKTLSGAPAVTRCEAAPLDHDWGLASPAAGVNADNFSARYSGSFNFTGGQTNFEAWGDDGVRVLVDGQIVINGWKDQAITHYTGSANLTAGAHTITIEFYDAFQDAAVKASWTGQATPPPPPTGDCPTDQFKAEYFNSITPGGAAVLTQCETAPLNHDWGLGSPAAGINTDNFSARYTGNFNFTAGEYLFETSADDGVRLTIDGNPVIDGWKDQEETGYSATRSLTAGLHSITIEYYDNTEIAVLRANWRPTSTNLPPQAVIVSPSDNASIDIGSTVNFNGYANDLEDGSIPAANLHWNLVLQHCAGGSCHTHFLQQFTGTTGSFVFPDHGTDEYYLELTLTATDSGGLTNSKTVRLNPKRAATCPADYFTIEYFNNTTLSGIANATGCNATVNFDWALGAPAPGVNADYFSARFTTTKTFTAGTYKFTTTGDDGVRLYIDGNLVINGWKDQAAKAYSANRTLTAGTHTIKLEYYEAAGKAVAKLSWVKL